MHIDLGVVWVASRAWYGISFLDDLAGWCNSDGCRWGRVEYGHSREGTNCEYHYENECAKSHYRLAAH